MFQKFYPDHRRWKPVIILNKGRPQKVLIIQRNHYRESKLRSWKSERNTCRDKGNYEFRLAKRLRFRPVLVINLSVCIQGGSYLCAKHQTEMQSKCFRLKRAASYWFSPADKFLANRTNIRLTKSGRLVRMCHKLGLRLIFDALDIASLIQKQELSDKFWLPAVARTVLVYSLINSVNDTRTKLKLILVSVLWRLGKFVTSSDDWISVKFCSFGATILKHN